MNSSHELNTEISVTDSDHILYVKNLTRNVVENHIKEIFGTYGEVLSVEMLPAAAAYVGFKNAESAEEAMTHLDGGQIDGAVIQVSFVLVSKKRQREASPSQLSRNRSDMKDRAPYNQHRERNRSTIERNSIKSNRSLSNSRNKRRSQSPPRRITRNQRSRSPLPRSDSRGITRRPRSRSRSPTTMSRKISRSRPRSPTRGKDSPAYYDRRKRSSSRSSSSYSSSSESSNSSYSSYSSVSTGRRR